MVNSNGQSDTIVGLVAEFERKTNFRFDKLEIRLDKVENRLITIDKKMDASQVCIEAEFALIRKMLNGEKS